MIELRKALRRYLVTGTFIIAPITISLLVILWFTSTIDRTVATPIEAFIGVHVPGLGVVLALVFLVVAGFLGSNIVGRHMLEFFEELLLRIPIFNSLYRTVKQLTEAFTPGDKLKFQSVVLVEYPSAGLLSLAFVTNQITLGSGAQAKEMLAVYVPTNHLYIGNVALVPKEKVIPTRLTPQEGIQITLSAGAGFPDAL